jgi:hypothetical protein
LEEEPPRIGKRLDMSDAASKAKCWCRHNRQRVIDQTMDKVYEMIDEQISKVKKRKE